MSSPESRASEPLPIRVRNAVVHHPIGAAGVAAITGVFLSVGGQVREANIELAARLPAPITGDITPVNQVVGPYERERARVLGQVYEERRQRHPLEFPLQTGVLILGVGGIILDASLDGRRRQVRARSTR